jgi:hypothetical protein
VVAPRFKLFIARLSTITPGSRACVSPTHAPQYQSAMVLKDFPVQGALTSSPSFQRMIWPHYCRFPNFQFPIISPYLSRHGAILALMTRLRQGSESWKTRRLRMEGGGVGSAGKASPVYMGGDLLSLWRAVRSGVQFFVQRHAVRPRYGQHQLTSW